MYRNKNLLIFLSFWSNLWLLKIFFKKHLILALKFFDNSFLVMCGQQKKAVLYIAKKGENI
jgi:hypothetical protein